MVQRPHVGVGAVIEREDGFVLLGLRKNSFGEGQWALPGGHIEFGETIFEAAKREVMEETALSLECINLISVCDELDFTDSHQKHGIAIGVHMRYNGAQPTICEPEKCARWEWFDQNALPQNMYRSSFKFLQNKAAGIVYQEHLL